MFFKLLYKKMKSLQRFVGIDVPGSIPFRTWLNNLHGQAHQTLFFRFHHL